MVAIFCGSRDWRDVTSIVDGLKALWTIAQRDFKLESRLLVTVLHGGAPGADTIAHVQATKMGFLVQVEPANWKLFGKAAGPLRNKAMLAMKPDIVFAFQLGASRGTQHMIDIATAAGVRVIVVYVPA